MPTNRTVRIVYDPLFLEHRPPGARSADAPPMHPEHPGRLQAVHDRLVEAGVFDEWLADRPAAAPSELLEVVHEHGHLQSLRAFTDGGGGFLEPDTYAGPPSLLAALHAAGAVMQCVDMVADGDAERAFALTRPPGHHATRARAMGFCLVNSVAVAAVHARSRGLGPVLVIDWDVHHGNGTQDIFYSDPEVLYLSTHQEHIYPGTGHVDEVGLGAGVGTNVNVPLPAATADDAYIEVFERVVVPAARRFQPGIILVSAGYDAHTDDPLATMSLSTAGYAQLARIVCDLADELCEGRVVACLEGGYDLDALADCVLATLRVFAGGDPEPPSIVSAHGNGRVREVIDVVRRAHELSG